MSFSKHRRWLKHWKSRSRKCKRRSTRRHLGQLLEPRVMLAGDVDLVVSGSVGTGISHHGPDDTR